MDGKTYLCCCSSPIIDDFVASRHLLLLLAFECQQPLLSIAVNGLGAEAMILYGVEWPHPSRCLMCCLGSHANVDAMKSMASKV